MPAPLFVLASSSTERKRLLDSVDLGPDLIVSPDIDETPRLGEKPRNYVSRMAYEKALAGSKGLTGSAFVLGADTIAVVGTRVLGKPKDKNEARAFFKLFSGRSHRVYTAVTLLNIAPGKDPKVSSKLVESKVTFTHMTDAQIESLVERKEWERCSGGYSIRGYAAMYIKTISGSLPGILGLPLVETAQLLRGQPGIRGTKRDIPSDSLVHGQDLHWPL